ncbi:hypothetical protein NPIL_611111, partial [Nephila pilipes]
MGYLVWWNTSHISRNSALKLHTHPTHSLTEAHSSGFISFQLFWFSGKRDWQIRSCSGKSTQACRSIH